MVATFGKVGGPLADYRPAANSSFANFARSVFCPTEVNRTTSLVSSSSGSTADDRPNAELRVPDSQPGFSPAGSD